MAGNIYFTPATDNVINMGIQAGAERTLGSVRPVTQFTFSDKFSVYDFYKGRAGFFNETELGASLGWKYGEVTLKNKTHTPKIFPNPKVGIGGNLGLSGGLRANWDKTDTDKRSIFAQYNGEINGEIGIIPDLYDSSYIEVEAGGDIGGRTYLNNPKVNELRYGGHASVTYTADLPGNDKRLVPIQYSVGVSGNYNTGKVGGSDWGIVGKAALHF